jgi:nucleotide-binding universal stress UspA family protein
MPAKPKDHRIVVGVDGSPSSREALRWAVRQAALTSSVVDAIIAWHDPSSYGGYGWLIADTSYEKFAAKTLSQTVDSTVAESTGVTVRQHVRADGADLLVVGSHGHKGFAGMLLGSVSQHCVHHAPCPVVIIRGHPRRKRQDSTDQLARRSECAGTGPGSVAGPALRP